MSSLRMLSTVDAGSAAADRPAIANMRVSPANAAAIRVCLNISCPFHAHGRSRTGVSRRYPAQAQPPCHEADAAARRPAGDNVPGSIENSRVRDGSLVTATAGGLPCDARMDIVTSTQVD